VQGDDAVVFGVGQGDEGHAVVADCDRLARALVVAKITADHVAIGSGRQARLERLLERGSVVVDGDESLAASTESDLVVAVVPPIVHCGAFDDVAEVDHVGDLAPAVLAHPTATAGTVGLDDRTYDVPVIVVRRSDPVVGVLAVDEVLIPVVAGHDAREAVGPSQHEGHGHLVEFGNSEGQDHVTAGSVSALVVVVVDEDQGATRRHHSPSLTKVAQELELIASAEGFAEEFSVFEFGDSANARVLGRRDGLAAQIDDFLFE